MRFFKIDLDDPDGPLVDITSPNVPRVFPRRYEQPSELQPSGAAEGWIDNPVDDQLPGLVTVGKERLIEPVKSFGQAYHAIPDDDEFECEYAPQGPPSLGDVVASGSDANAGLMPDAVHEPEWQVVANQEW